jgi:hypothetical protein
MLLDDELINDKIFIIYSKDNVLKHNRLVHPLMVGPVYCGSASLIFFFYFNRQNYGKFLKFNCFSIKNNQLATELVRSSMQKGGNIGGNHQGE